MYSGIGIYRIKRIVVCCITAMVSVCGAIDDVAGQDTSARPSLFVSNFVVETEFPIVWSNSAGEVFGSRLQDLLDIELNAQGAMYFQRRGIEYEYELEGLYRTLTRMKGGNPDTSQVIGGTIRLLARDFDIVLFCFLKDGSPLEPADKIVELVLVSLNEEAFGDILARSNSTVSITQLSGGGDQSYMSELIEDLTRNYIGRKDYRGRNTLRRFVVSRPALVTTGAATLVSSIWFGIRESSLRTTYDAYKDADTFIDATAAREDTESKEKTRDIARVAFIVSAASLSFFVINAYVKNKKRPGTNLQRASRIQLQSDYYGDQFGLTIYYRF